MRQIEFATSGTPEEVVVCAEVDGPGVPAPDEVLVKVLAFPINPADLLTMQGIYPRLDPDTRAIGNEAVGEVAAVGGSVTDLAPGDRVMLLSLNNWREYRSVGRQEIIKLSPRGDVLQQCGLKVNPATADLLLGAFVPLKTGDWMIQNAANSAVGRAAIQLARATGIRTINIVRRAAVIGELTALGADCVLLDGEDLADRVAAVTGRAAIALGTDCIGGRAANRIASCLATGGTLVVYGAMGGEPVTIDPATIVFGDLSVRGLWLTRHLLRASSEDIASLYGRLDGMSVSGRLVARIDSVFPAGDIRNAVRRASQSGIDGKVVVRFN